MSIIWVCPIDGGEVEPLMEPALTFHGILKQREILQPHDGCVCKECRLVFPKARLKPKYVWSRQDVWTTRFSRVARICDFLMPEPEPELRIQPVVQAQINEEKGVVMNREFYGNDNGCGTRRKPTKDECEEFLKTPITQRREIRVADVCLEIDYTGTMAVIRKNGCKIAEEVGATLRAMAANNPQGVVMAWASMSVRKR